MSTPVAQAATTAAKNAGFITRLEQGPLRRYLGVDGGVLLRGGPFASLNATSPTFRKFNNALTLAPLWKWGLAIVPLMGVFTGTPSVENLDVNTSIALASTGAIWAYYSTLVRPKAVSLGVVSIALLGANGYNVWRRYESAAQTDRQTDNPQHAVHICSLWQRTDSARLLLPPVCGLCSYEQKKKAGLLPAQTASSSPASASTLADSHEPLLTAQVGNKALAA